MKILYVDFENHHETMADCLNIINPLELKITTTYLEGKKLANEFRPDVIICAHNMGDQSGAEFARQIRHIFNIPCLILTSSLNSGDKAAFAEEGLNVMLRYDINPQMLVKKIHELASLITKR